MFAAFILAFSGGGRGCNAVIAALPPTGSVPSTPTNPTAIKVGSTFNIVWDDPQTNADGGPVTLPLTINGYRTQTAGQAFAGGTGATLFTVAGAVETYTSPALGAGAWYINLFASSSAGQGNGCGEQQVTI